MLFARGERRGRWWLTKRTRWWMRSKRSSVRSIARKLPVLAAFLVVLECTVVGEPPAEAALTLMVDRIDDTLAANACTSAPNDCSLRGALDRANATPGADTIELPANMTFTLTAYGPDENANATGDLDILESVTINGNGSTVSGSLVEGEAPDRAFDVLPNFVAGTVTINNLTVTNCASQGGGGGLLVEFGTFIADQLIVTGNRAGGSDGGGGILLGGVDATLTHVTISSNTADVQGGGLAFYSSDHALRISDSTITDNSAVNGGGADLSGRVTIENTDFTRNHALGEPPMFAGNGGGVRLIKGSLTIRGGTFTTNDAFSDGGAMFIIGDADVSGTQVKDNNAPDGAGIYASPFNQNGSVVFDHMTISGNDATRSGGGMFLLGGTLTNSEISHNTAMIGGAGVVAALAHLDRDLVVFNDTRGNGGGIVAPSFSSSVISNSTIYLNTALGLGGGIFKGDLSPSLIAQGGVIMPALEVRYTTIDNNVAQPGAGANIHVVATDGVVSLLGSIVAYSGLQHNCNAALFSSGYNIEDGHSCGLTSAGDEQDTDPALLVLADSGGPTLTQALQDGSPAVDHVTSGCPPPATDQRGYLRPAGLACDAGAFELGAFTPRPTPSNSPPPSPTESASPTASPTSTSTPGTPTPRPTESAPPTASPTSTSRPGMPTPSPTESAPPTASPTSTSTPATPTPTPRATPTRTSTNTATATPPATGTSTVVESLTATPFPTPTSPRCVGDCDGSHAVTVDDLLRMVNIALGSADISTCTAGDQNDDRRITIDEILTAVNNALSSCD